MNSAEIQLTPQLEPYRGLVVTLIQEIQGLAQVSNSDTPFIRRATIRTMFSVLEGAINLAKQYLLDNFSDRYTPQEIVALTESSIKLNEKGEINENSYFPRIHENFLFTINMFQKGIADKHEINRKSLYWKSFLKFIQMRHDLTHPKVTSDLDVTKEQIEDFGWILLWVIDNVIEVLCTCKGKQTPEAIKLENGWTSGVNAIILAKYKPALAVILDPTFECSDEVRKEVETAIREIVRGAEESLLQAQQKLAELESQ